MSKHHHYARQAAVALLKLAKITTSSAVAVGLVRVAADLKERAGELPAPDTLKVPDVEAEG